MWNTEWPAAVSQDVLHLALARKARASRLARSPRGWVSAAARCTARCKRRDPRPKSAAAEYSRKPQAVATHHMIA